MPCDYDPADEATEADIAAFLRLPMDVLLDVVETAVQVRADMLAFAYATMISRGDAVATVAVRLPPGLWDRVHLFRYDPGTA